jgi:hypothetical protein
MYCIEHRHGVRFHRGRARKRSYRNSGLHFRFDSVEQRQSAGATINQEPNNVEHAGSLTQHHRHDLKDRETLQKIASAKRHLNVCQKRNSIDLRSPEEPRHFFDDGTKLRFGATARARS